MENDALEALKEFLRENLSLSLTVDTEEGRFGSSRVVRTSVKLYLGDEVISSADDYFNTEN